MPQLAANWPDKKQASPVSSLIDLETQAGGRQGGTLYESDRERLSEKTLPISLVAKRSDSPTPDKLSRAIELWENGIVWKVISVKVGVPERTIRRYLTAMGYKRDYAFVSEKLKEYKKTKEHIKNLSLSRILRGSAKGEKNPNWKGGGLNIEVRIWNTTEYKAWRSRIFKRDKFTCKGCGILGGRLEAHHILPRRDFSHLTFEISNGITLCRDCHKKTIRKEYLSVNIWKQRVA